MCYLFVYVTMPRAWYVSITNRTSMTPCHVPSDCLGDYTAPELKQKPTNYQKIHIHN